LQIFVNLTTVNFPNCANYVGMTDNCITTMNFLTNFTNFFTKFCRVWLYTQIQLQIILFLLFWNVLWIINDLFFLYRYFFMNFNKIVSFYGQYNKSYLLFKKVYEYSYNRENLEFIFHKIIFILRFIANTKIFMYFVSAHQYIFFSLLKYYGFGEK
jgi:hypothetical protein